MKYPKFACLVIAAVLLAGCTSVVERRISHHEDAWGKLSHQDQERLRRGLVRAGDTEEMVLIALGPPDEELPITDPAGRKQKEWLYDLLESDFSGSPFEPSPGHIRMPILARRYVFQDGVLVGHQGNEGPRPGGVRWQDNTEFMLARLNRLVHLTPEQLAQARAIFARANEALSAISPEQRPENGAPIRIEMRREIREILTPPQQDKYDATPQYLGGGSMKKPGRS